ncbi:hypothetical protein MTR67_026470 [Solanum verrucosum]|uniref:DUF4218 domain-containing protein n=1 Tax=Solanum verrucosum TaxID=315347 RepID=A0AAF0TZ76_SOLVR|nr:hypothetical protein MTR67_026470 [Solanum verrucosum]
MSMKMFVFHVARLLVPFAFASCIEIDLKEKSQIDQDAIDVENYSGFVSSTNDMLAGNLSGWSTKGYMACPTCNKDASSQKVRCKICYMGHRRHLEPSHSWRRSKKFDGCVSVDDGKITRLKSHDYHVLLQRVLPIALRGFLNKDVSLALIELGHFFQRLCCKTLRKDDLEQLERDIIIILCNLEMIFPPTFFDVMVHLAVHLPREAMYGGPVQYRWMYKIERFLCKLKRYVRNKARPEGSIAEGYIIDECLTFCSMFLLILRLDLIVNIEMMMDLAAKMSMF